MGLFTAGVMQQKMLILRNQPHIRQVQHATQHWKIVDVQYDTESFELGGGLGGGHNEETAFMMCP